MRTPPSQELLLSTFRFDFENGLMFWKRAPKNKAQLLNKEAGSVHWMGSKKDRPYWVVKIDGVGYLRSRLMFLAFHGEWPAPTVDHRNRNSLDDSIDNLRPATNTQNVRNRRFKERVRNGVYIPPGVICGESGKFYAKICKEGKNVHLGTFDTPDAAHAVYMAERKKLFGDFA